MRLIQRCENAVGTAAVEVLPLSEGFYVASNTTQAARKDLFFRLPKVIVCLTPLKKIALERVLCRVNSPLNRKQPKRHARSNGFFHVHLPFNHILANPGKPFYAARERLESNC